MRVAGAALIVSTIFLAVLTLSLAAKPPAIVPVAKAPDEITVTVTDFNSGKPLANATVRININQDRDHPIDSKVTGVDGLVHLSAANSAAWTQLTVTVTGTPWATSQRYWYPTRSAPTPPAHFDITLQNAITMGGTAVDDANHPLAGATPIGGESPMPNTTTACSTSSPNAPPARWTHAPGIPEYFQSIDIAVFHPGDCLGDNGGVWFENVTDLPALPRPAPRFSDCRAASPSMALSAVPTGNLSPPQPSATAAAASAKFPSKPDGSFHLGVLPEKTSIVTVFAPGFAPRYPPDHRWNHTPSRSISISSPGKPCRRARVSRCPGKTRGRRDSAIVHLAQHGRFAPRR